MDPAEVIASTLLSAWDAPEPGEPDVFPGTHTVAEMVLEGLRLQGFCVVPVPEYLPGLVSRLEGRNVGVPSYSYLYDKDAEKSVVFMLSAMNF